MKKIIIIFTLIISGYGTAQVGVNTTEPKAVLDIKSEFLGVQFPRLTSAEILQIQNPEEGLMIYNVTEKCLAINIGDTQPDWKCLTMYEPTEQ
ncbi:hypothetical protein KRX57_07405 [Weeksellaceae bacterium TAE3-ERU29]|nr:hypothetical protein [Weeksellaceae bacterium TAE3-ERU29]